MFSRRDQRMNRGRVEIPPPILDPRTIPDLVGWFSPYNPEFYTLSGADVSIARDLSGSGNDASAGAATPTLVAGGIGPGHDGFFFVAASSQHLLANSLGAAFSGSDTPLSAFGIVKHTLAQGGTHTLWSMGLASSATPIRRWCNDSTDHWFRQHRNDANTLFSSTSGLVAATLTGSAQLVSHVAEGPGEDAGWINGTPTNTQTDSASGDTTLDEMAFGCFFNAGTKNQFWDGYMGEMLFYKRAVNNEERLRIEEYLLRNAGLP